MLNLMLNIVKTPVGPPEEERLVKALREVAGLFYQGDSLKKIIQLKEDVIAKDIFLRKYFYEQKHPIRWMLADIPYLVLFLVILVCLIAVKLEFNFFSPRSLPLNIILAFVFSLAVFMMFNNIKVQYETSNSQWMLKDYDIVYTSGSYTNTTLDLFSYTMSRNQPPFKFEELYHPASEYHFLVVSDPEDPCGDYYYIHAWEEPKTES
jgi:hypothetical protein